MAETPAPLAKPVWRVEGTNANGVPMSMNITSPSAEAAKARAEREGLRVTSVGVSQGDAVPPVHVESIRANAAFEFGFFAALAALVVFGVAGAIAFAIGFLLFK
jgi:ribosomal protein S12 methylthiotransferase accessory factor YcaO